MKRGTPTIHIVGQNIPQAYYRAIKAVWEQGHFMPTQYDRRDTSGQLIDPPSKDAKVLIEITDPLSQPRHPPISFCEIGTYIAEFFGVKDHLVVPMSLLKMVIRKEEISKELEQDAKKWPYTYHQRLVEHPESDSTCFDQLASAIDFVAKVPYNRRSMVTTAVPNIDPLLPEDIPCLRELQLRCEEDDDGVLWLSPTTMWRSRDLYKAWGDNVIAMTCFLQSIAKSIGEASGREVRLGLYADFSCSLHIYGQDFAAVGGDASKGIASFFDAFPDEDSFIVRSLTSEMKAPFIIADLEGLKSEKLVEQWRFSKKSLDLIDQLIREISDGSLIV